MRAFAAAEADVSAENHFAREEERESTAEPLVHVGKIEIAASEGDFACVVESEKANRADDAAIVFRLDKEGVWSTETEIAEGAESRLIINVAAADGFLQIERNGVRCAGVGHGEAEANAQDAVKAAMTIFGFGIKAVAKIGDEAAEGKVARVGVVKIAIAEAIVKLKMI